MIGLFGDGFVFLCVLYLQYCIEIVVGGCIKCVIGFGSGSGCLWGSGFGGRCFYVFVGGQVQCRGSEQGQGQGNGMMYEFIGNQIYWCILLVKVVLGWLCLVVDLLFFWRLL